MFCISTVKFQDIGLSSSKCRVRNNWELGRPTSVRWRQLDIQEKNCLRLGKIILNGRKLWHHSRAFLPEDPWHHYFDLVFFVEFPVFLKEPKVSLATSSWYCKMHLMMMWQVTLSFLKLTADMQNTLGLYKKNTEDSIWVDFYFNIQTQHSLSLWLNTQVLVSSAWKRSASCQSMIHLQLWWQHQMRSTVSRSAALCGVAWHGEGVRGKTGPWGRTVHPDRQLENGASKGPLQWDVLHMTSRDSSEISRMTCCSSSSRFVEDSNCHIVYIKMSKGRYSKYFFTVQIPSLIMS